MCVYVVVLVGCCCICGGPHLTRLSLRAAAWDSRNPLQFANELSVKAHAGGQPRANSPKPAAAIMPGRVPASHVRSARARSQFLWWACFMPPKGKKQQQGNNPSSSQMSNERFINAARTAQPAQPAHAAAIAATGRRRRPCEACRPKAASLTVHIGPAHLLASGCWPKLIGN